MRPIDRVRRPGLALSLSSLLIVGSLSIVAPVLAAGNSIRVEPSVTSDVPVGGTFSVNVIQNAEVATSGIQATVTFDQTLLQITSVARGAAFADAPSNVPVNFTSAIANANSDGSLDGVASFFFPPDAVSAGDATFLTIGFQVVACGASAIGLDLGSSFLLDGREDTYGDALELTAAGATASTPCPTPTPEPTETPEPTATPDPTPTPTPASPGSGTTTVTGTVGVGFLAVTAPAEVEINLFRNVLNEAIVPVTVLSNIAWDLNVNDPKLDNTGHMTSGSNALEASMTAEVDPNPQVDLEVGGTLTSGANSTDVDVLLKQFVGPLDPTGDYSIDLVFEAISGF